jgi:predicted metal-dependent hydrolase
VLRRADIDVEVVQKDIKNVHLSVYPPDGRVRVAAPSRMSTDSLRAFLAVKLPWIRTEQQRFQEQERRQPPLYTDRESHNVWGERVLLSVVEHEAAPSVDLSHINLKLQVRPGSDAARREEVLSLWFRDQVRAAAAELRPTWERLLGVQAEKVFVQHMKTQWGSCTPARRTIRLNTELARKPRACLEYILVHELVHLIEPTHNARFRALMDRHLPSWPLRRDELNRSPLAHEEWGY